MADNSSANLRACYPEMAAGGFSRVDGTVEFYTRINALLRPEMAVLDFGAGRGAQLDRDQDKAPYRTALCRIQGKVKRLVGVDVDSAILANPFLDEAYVIELGSPIPLPDKSFDLIYADWVLEHVANPESFAAEVRRLLKPGGWFCARTPNRWGMIGIGANLVPNKLHTTFLAILQPERKEIDVFPTTYCLNTRGAVRRYFDRVAWDDFSYVSNSVPPYVQRSRMAMRLVQLYWRLTPTSLHTVLHVFLRLK